MYSAIEIFAARQFLQTISSSAIQYLLNTEAREPKGAEHPNICSLEEYTETEGAEHRNTYKMKILANSQVNFINSRIEYYTST